MNDPKHPAPEDVARFLASQSILLSLLGVPGIYVHSLFGSRNCHACFRETGRARSLNREKFQLAEIEARLANPESHESLVFAGYRELLAVRRQHKAFHPFGSQEVLFLHPAIFAVLRLAPDESEQVLCLTNVSDQRQRAPLPPGRWRDLFMTDAQMLSGEITLPGYGVRWLMRLES